MCIRDRHPVPLIQMPNAREFGIGAGVLAGVTALAAAGVWVAQRIMKDSNNT